MTDKPHRCFALPGHGVVTLQGRDAVGFSQAQFMSDVKSLDDGAWQWSGWLTPKGRVVALFALLRRDAETVWLVTPDADAAALALALRRFVFRSKVAIEASGVPVAGEFADGAAEARMATDRSQACAGPGGTIVLDMSAEGAARRLVLGGEAGPVDPAALERWTAADLLHGLPRLPASQAEKWTPQQLSLERLRAFSVKKGCYPGQEIVARTHFLGQAKRGLVLLEGDAPVSTGADVAAGGTTLGTVVSSAGTLALAVMPLDAERQGMVVDGTAVRERPLLGGLGRG